MEQEKISIRRMNYEDLDIIKEFYKRAFQGDIEKKFQALKWICFNNPIKDQNNNYLLIFSNDKMVGYLGVMPTKIFHNGQPFLASFGQEILIDPQVRKQGLASKLLDEINKSDKPILGLWQNEKLISILQKDNWHNLGHFQPYIKIFNINNFLRLKFSKNISRMLSSVFSLYFRRKGNMKTITSSNYEVEIVNRFGNEFDEFFYSVVSKQRLIADRTAALLNWKYVDIPNKKYTILAARKNKKLCAYLVLRFEDQEAIKKGIIVDLLASPEEVKALDILIRKSSDIFTEFGADFSACLVIMPQIQKLLKKHGYMKTSKETCNCILAKNVEKFPDKAGITDKNWWYLTFGDSDGDMW
jgi:hypothetical protein